MLKHTMNGGKDLQFWHIFPSNQQFAALTGLGVLLSMLDNTSILIVAFLWNSDKVCFHITK